LDLASNFLPMGSICQALPVVGRLPPPEQPGAFAGPLLGAPGGER